MGFRVSGLGWAWELLGEHPEINVHFVGNLHRASLGPPVLCSTHVHVFLNLQTETVLFQVSGADGGQDIVSFLLQRKSSRTSEHLAILFKTSASLRKREGRDPSYESHSSMLLVTPYDKTLSPPTVAASEPQRLALLRSAVSQLERASARDELVGVHPSSCSGV